MRTLARQKIQQNGNETKKNTNNRYTEWNVLNERRAQFSILFLCSNKKTAVIRLLFVTISISLICMHIEIGPILCIQLHLTKSKNTNQVSKHMYRNRNSVGRQMLSHLQSFATCFVIISGAFIFIFFLNFKYNAKYGAAMAKLCVCVQKNCWHEFLLLILLSFERLSVWPINMSKFKWNEHTHMNSLHTLSEIIGIAFRVPHTQIRTHNRNN